MLWRALQKYCPYVLPGVAAVTAWAWYSWRRKAMCDSPSRRNSTEKARPCDGGAVALDPSRTCASPGDRLNVCAAANADPRRPDGYPDACSSELVMAPLAEAHVRPPVGESGEVSSAAKLSGVSPEICDIAVVADSAASLSEGARERCCEREMPVRRTEDNLCDARPSNDTHELLRSLTAPLKGNRLAEPIAVPLAASAPETLPAADASGALPTTDSIGPLPASASIDRSKTNISDGLGVVNGSDTLPKVEKSSMSLPSKQKDLSNLNASHGSDVAERIPEAVAVSSQSPILLDSPVTVETNANSTTANGSSATLESGEVLTSPNTSSGQCEIFTDLQSASQLAGAYDSWSAGAADSTATSAGPCTVVTNCSRNALSANESKLAASINQDVGEATPTLERSELRCQNSNKCEAKADTDVTSSKNMLQLSTGKLINEKNVSDTVFSKDDIGSGAAFHKMDQTVIGGSDDGKVSGSEAAKCVGSCKLSERRGANDCGERCDPEGSDKVDPLCLKTEMGRKLSRENYLGGSGKDYGDNSFIQEAEELHVKDINVARCSLPFQTSSCSNALQAPPAINSVPVAGPLKSDLEISRSAEKTEPVPVSCHKEPEHSPLDKATWTDKVQQNGDVLGDGASHKAPEEQFASGFVEKLFQDVRESIQSQKVCVDASRESDDQQLVSSTLSAEAAPFTPTAVEAESDIAAPCGAASPVDAAHEEHGRDGEPATAGPPNGVKGNGGDTTMESPSLVKSNLSPEAPPFKPTLVESPTADKPFVEQEPSGGEAVSKNGRSVEDLSKSIHSVVNVKEIERSPKKGKSSLKLFPSSTSEGKWLVKDRTPEKFPKKKAVKSTECLEKNSSVAIAHAPAVVPVENCTGGDPKESIVKAEENVTNGLSTSSEDSESRATLDDLNAEAVSDGSCPCVTVSSDTISGDGGEMVIWEFHVSKILVGRLIGKQGKFINYVKEGSGAKIYIMEVPYTSDFQITHIEGTSEQVEAALNLIRKKFKNLNLNNIAASMPPQIGHVVVPVAPVSIPQGISVDVTVPWFDAYGNLFLQQYTHPTFHALDSLDQALNACYSQPSLPPLLPPLNADTVCAALLEGRWYRAQIMEYYPGSNEVEVKCLDYGGYYKILASDLRQLRTDFLTLPFQASHVYFANLAPLPGHTCYTEEALMTVNKLTLGAQLIAQVTRFDTSSQLPFVNLWLIKEGRSQMINKMLVDAGHAQWLS